MEGVTDKIHYWCPVDNNGDDIGLFMGFTPGVPELTNRIKQLIHWPSNISALEHDSITLAKFRIVGEYYLRIIPFNVGLISRVFTTDTHHLNIIVSSKKNEELVESFLQKDTSNVFHLTNSELTEGVYNYDFRTQKILEFIRSHSHLRNFSKSMSTFEKYSKREKILPHKRDHGVTGPNDDTLEHLGFQFSKIIPLCSSNEEDYVNEIAASSKRLAAERKKLEQSLGRNLQAPVLDLVLACPSFFHQYWSLKNFNNLFGGITTCEKELTKSLKFCTREQSYSNSTNTHELEEIRNNPFFELCMTELCAETHAFRNLLTFLGFSEVCPVIRLPRGVNRCHGELKMLGNHLRGNVKPANIMNKHKLARRVSSVIYDKGFSYFKNSLQGWNKRVKVTSDIPLEIVPVDGIPLGIRHFVSRLPTVPGNVFSTHCIDREISYCNIDAFNNIVIFRSFSEGDPVRVILEECVESYSQNEGWNIEWSFIDVNTKAELVEALRNNESPLVVFDCHGGHCNTTQEGYLAIGEDKVNSFELREITVMPPIVVLSCCDACPPDRSHASVVNGFLACSVKAIYAPVFPVDGVKSGLNTARLLYRLSCFVNDWIQKYKSPFSWDQIICSQNRATYVTEMLFQMVNENLISLEESKDFMFSTTHLINMKAENWFNHLFECLSVPTGWNYSDFLDYIENRFFFPEALYYGSFGSPEKLIFSKDGVSNHND